MHAFMTFGLVAALVCLSSATPLVAAAAAAPAPCSQAPSNFSIYADVNGKYAALGGPCRTHVRCLLFFVADGPDTTFSILDNGLLTISQAQGGSNLDRPDGYIATLPKYESFALQFISKKLFLQETKDHELIARPKCSIQPSTTGDQTCDLVCTAPGRQSSNISGFSLDEDDSNLLFLGDDGTSTQIKVTF